MLGIESAHQVFLAADNSDRHSTGDRLSIHDDIGLNAEIFLRSARGEPEAAEYLVEDQRYSAGAANLAQLAQPLSVIELDSWVLRTPLVSRTVSLGGGELGWKD